MVQTTQSTFRYKRAIVTFFLAYLVITIVATAFSLLLVALIDVAPATMPLQDPGYLLSEKFLPFLNLIVWTASGLVYFKGRANRQSQNKEALALGAIWLAMALPLDFLAFVVIQNPLSLSASDFYIGQFPWIYLIYLAVFISPLCALGVRKLVSGNRTLQTNRAAF